MPFLLRILQQKSLFLHLIPLPLLLFFKIYIFLQTLDKVKCPTKKIDEPTEEKYEKRNLKYRNKTDKIKK